MAALALLGVLVHEPKLDAQRLVERLVGRRALLHARLQECALECGAGVVHVVGAAGVPVPLLRRRAPRDAPRQGCHER